MESVEREVYVEARPEVVWAAVAQPEGFARWYAFGGAEIDLRPGGRLVMRWDEHGEYLGFVEKVEPGRRFAYRYAVEPGVEPAPGNSNLVEFTLTPEGEGTRLRVVESGFERLEVSPDEQVRRAEESEQGWDGALAALTELAPTL
ncbi:SRPBCC domain-containing protein [Kribbella sp. NBC_00359]|jgi:uncharacterized protein YndB with AHSA1/START domain|uniref:SRPBCC domain-containing protein n=1 Tax=Kribbella sp. NBC_00359 TaxID=2975966 RepID=UPI002E204ADA